MRALAAVPQAQILLGPWWSACATSRRVWPALVAAAWLLPVALLAYLKGAQAATVLALLIPAVYLQLLGLALLISLVQQNHPHAARLVPGHLQHLRACAAILMLVLAPASGLLMGAALGQPLVWSLGAGVCLLLIGISVRWPEVWWWLWIVPSTAWWWSDAAAWRLLSGALREWHAEQPLSLAACALLVLPWLLSRIVLAGGTGHRRAQARAAQWRRKARSTRWSLAEMPGSGGIGAAFNWLYGLWHRCLLAHARLQSRSVLARAELVLYGNSHWSAHLGAVLLVMALVALLAVCVVAGTPATWELVRSKGVAGMTIGVMSGCFSPLLGLPAAIHQSRREQALLMLLPGMPRGAALNQALARRQMWHAVGALLMALLLLRLLLGSQALNNGALMVAVGLLLSVSLWADGSRRGLPRGLWYVALIGGGVLLAISLAVVLDALAWPRWLALPLALPVWLGLLRRRWRQLRAWPQALPAGRNIGR
nr:hypothetical protein [uncultured Roseateles sp.]